MSYIVHIISERKNKLCLQRSKIFLIMYVPLVYMEIFACGVSSEEYKQRYSDSTSKENETRDKLCFVQVHY